MQESVETQSEEVSAMANESVNSEETVAEESAELSEASERVSLKLSFLKKPKPFKNLKMKI